MLHDHQIVAVALLVSEKQVLAVCGVDAGPMLVGLERRRDRRVFVTFERYAQSRERLLHLFFLRCHSEPFGDSGTSTAAPFTWPCRRSARAALAFERS